MIRNVRLHKVLWILASILVMAAAGLGTASPEIYSVIASPGIIPGVFTQDLLAFSMAIVC